MTRVGLMQPGIIEFVTPAALACSTYTSPAMYQLVLIRHGESTWNLENRFTGWTDVELTPTGVEQAREAGRLLKAEGFEFDIAYTSVLKRAIWTLWHALDQMDRTWLPVVNEWRLNERHYGALQGLNKAETAKQYGDEQVLVWRRSYDTPPPALDAGRSALGTRRSALRQASTRASAADRMPEGYGRARAAAVAFAHRAGDPRRPAHSDRRPMATASARWSNISTASATTTSSG